MRLRGKHYVGCLAFLSLLITALLAGGGTNGTAAPGTGGQDGRIAFGANENGFAQIAVMRASGGGRHRLTPPPPPRSDAAGNSSPSWSPDGQWIVFTSTGKAVREDERDFEIYVMRSDGSGRRRLTHNHVPDYSVAWSPGGNLIAFAQGASPNSRRTALWTMRPDGSHRRKLTSSRFFDALPTWSPGGRWIAFTRLIPGSRRISPGTYVIRASGQGQTRRLGEGIDPDWSPDGGRIAFISYRDHFGRTCFHECAGSAELYVMDSTGRHEKRLTRSRADDLSPDFSPNGRLLAFSSDRSDRPGHAYELYLASADGSCVRRITRTGDGIWEGGPDWDRSAGQPQRSFVCQR